MSTADDFTVFRRVAGDKIAELTERAEKAERELAAAKKKILYLYTEVDNLIEDNESLW